MSSNDSSCRSQLDFIASSQRKQESWAVKLFDFPLRLPDEIFNQNWQRHDIFNECLKLRHETHSIGIIQGQYCSISGESLYGGPKPNNGQYEIEYSKSEAKIKFGIAFCISAACSDDRSEIYANSELIDYNLVAKKIYCVKSQDVSVSVLDYFILFLLSALVILAAASTFYEMRIKKNRNCRRNPFTAFSLYTNIKELLHIDFSHSQKSIACINGLRSLAAIWVIISHRLSRAFEDPNFMLTRPLEQSNFFYEIILHTSIPVDVFIFLSALLSTQSCLWAFESTFGTFLTQNRRKFNFLKFCIHRYVRYTPSVLVLMLFIISFIPHLFINGPYEKVKIEQIERCQNYWWSTLLMIQNYVNVDGSCIPPAWYLCVDYQLYVITPVLVFAVWKYGYRTFWLHGLLIFATQTYLFFMRFNNKVTNHDVYTKTHFRFGQWITGIIFGYLMYYIENSSPKIEMSKKVRRVLWIASALSLVIFQNSYATLFNNILPDSFYQAIQDILFMCFLGLAIITFHHYRSGNIFRWFLSHPFWQPFAKLTLSTFLVHDIYIFMTIANVKVLTNYSFGWMLMLFAKDIVVSTILGAILYLFVEIPIVKFSNYYLGNKRESIDDVTVGPGTPLHRS